MNEQANGWIDKQGDIWRDGDDGLMHTPETRPFPREYVERKWGPLTSASATQQALVPVPGVRLTEEE